MRSKKKVIAAVASVVCFAAMMSTTAYASGDVAGAVTSTLVLSISLDTFYSNKNYAARKI